MGTRIAYLIVAIFAALSVFAQEQEGGGFDQTQVITGDRSLTVQKAFKISEPALPLEIEVEMNELDYTMIPKRPALELQVDTIPPARVKVREPLEKLYRGFVKAGVGTFATPYLEAYYSSERDREMSYGAHIRHLSHNDGINRPVAFSGLSQNGIDLWGKKIIGKHALQAKLGYDRNVWYYYGFDPQDADIDKKDIRQTFNLFELNTDWKSYYRDSSKVNHDLNLDIYHLGDAYESNELGVKAGANLRTYRGAQFYTLDLGFDLISFKGGGVEAFEFIRDTIPNLPGDDETNAIFSAVPKIVLRSGDFRADVGIGLYGRFSNQARFHAFPDVHFSYSLFNDLFAPYAGITGNVERVGYRTLTEQNPFILNQVPLENTINRYRVFGGFRGSVSDNLSFNVGVSYTRGDNTPLFVNDTLYSRENRFSVIYDRVTTLAFSGEVSYVSKDGWQANLSGEVFSYETENEEEAWHLPSYRFAAKGSYNLYDKFILGVSFNLIGSRRVKSLWPIPDQDPTEGGFWNVELDPYLDLGLSAEYRYTSRLSVFIEANNLTATKYDIYYRFPAQRAFILGGAKFSF